MHHPEALEQQEAACREQVCWQRVAAGQVRSRAATEARVDAWRNRRLWGRSVYCNCPVSTVCHAPLDWNSASMFFSVSGVAKRELARGAEHRLVR